MVTINDFGNLERALNEQRDTNIPQKKVVEKKSDPIESKKGWVINIGEEYELTPSLRLKVKAYDPDTELITMELSTGGEVAIEATPLSDFLEEAEDLYETEYDTKDGVDSKISLMQGTLKRTKDSLKKKLLELKIAILKEVSEEFDNSEDEQTDKKNVSTPQSFILPSSSKRKIRFTSTDPYNLGSDNKFYRKIQESKKKEDRKVSTEFKNGDIMRTKNGVEILFDKIFTQKKRAFVIVKGPQGDSTYPLEEFNNLIKDGTFSFTGENRAGNTSSLKLETTEELEIKKLEKKLLEIKTKREEIAKKLLELNSNIENVYKKPPTEDKSYISTAVGNMATGITENLYKQLFESLQKGSTKMAGLEEPILYKATPYYKKGLIKTQEDLKNFYSIETNRKKILASIKIDDVRRDFYVEIPEDEERGKTIIFKKTAGEVEKSVNKKFDDKLEKTFGKVVL
jgi:hypothetical protein